MTTATTKIVIVAGQEFSVPAETSNEAIRTQLTQMGFADVAKATIKTDKRKIGDEEVQTIEFVKNAGTKGMDGLDLAELIARVPAAPLPVLRRGGPDREQIRLLRQLRDGELTIGDAVACTDEIHSAVYSLDRPDTFDYLGSRLCDRLSLHAAPADIDVRGW